MSMNPTAPQPEAPLIIVAGQEGSGKTTAIVNLVEAYGGVIIPTESGLQAATKRKVTAFPVIAKSTPDKPELFLDQLYECFEWCWDNMQAGQVLALDTITVLYQRLEQTVLNRYGEKNIAACAGGYGKGFLEIRSEMMSILDELNALRAERDIAVVMTGHMEPTVLKNSPDVEAALCYSLAMDKNSAQLFKQQAHAVICIGIDTVVSGAELDNKGKVKQAGRIVKSSKRHLFADASTPAYSQLAKNRFNMPAKQVFVEDSLDWIDSCDLNDWFNQ